MKIVLQKLIASSGLCSRHEAERMILSGRVIVNGRTGRLGERAEATDEIMVDHKKLSFTNNFLYIKLHKPAGFVCTTRVFPGEKNIFSLLTTKKVLGIVGRLDKESEGLVILTDDGELAYHLTHPKFGVKKVYVVTLGHDIGTDRSEEKKKIAELIEKFKKGVDIGLGDGVVRADHIKHLRGRTFEVTLGEGKKRQIRRMFRKLNCHVTRLSRVRIGPLTVGGVRRGEWKYISKEDVAKLKEYSKEIVVKKDRRYEAKKDTTKTKAKKKFFGKQDPRNRKSFTSSKAKKPILKKTRNRK
ncbi:MAG: pseudouridine synthase [Candidatus Falkowbacteria bacterium]|nr:pseudouridine synthase [Candidatus Falkowbacteria bacterium]